jgi:hypothetical protein
MTEQAAFSLALYFRIAERITLTMIIILLCFVVMIAFWRSIQRIEIQLSKEKLGAAGSVVLSTPVFMLLALVGYSYVSLSNPVAIDLGERKLVGVTHGASSTRSRDAPTGQAAADNTAFERQRATNAIRSVNCAVGDISKRTTQIQDDIAEVKLHLMKSVWMAQWGNYASFSDYVLGRSTAPPNREAQTIFEAEHSVCDSLSSS